MKTIEVDEDLYRYIAGQTQHIGESASDILRRLLSTALLEADHSVAPSPMLEAVPAAAPAQDLPSSNGIVVSKDAGNEIEVDGVKVIRSLLISDEFAACKKAIDRFMAVLSALYTIDSASFAEATQVKGRTRVYFAQSERELLASGKTTKPKAIPRTPFWVITNSNTERKRQMVEQLMTRMGFQSELIEKASGSI